jgi:hypothetical protein
MNSKGPFKIKEDYEKILKVQGHMPYLRPIEPYSTTSKENLLWWDRHFN